MRRRAVLFLTAMTAALVAVQMVSTLASAQTGATFVVNSTADTGDATPDGTCNTCTLREAIQEANASPGADTINFAIPANGPHTISPTSELPTVEDPVTINGYTESLGESTPASPNTLAFGTNANLRIIISGASAPLGSNGLVVAAGPTTIRGLVINGFQETTSDSGGHAIFFFAAVGNSNTNNVVEGNFIGTNSAGTVAVPNEGRGVNVGSTSTGTTIGGTTPDKRNLISANGGSGVRLLAAATIVRGNLVGTNKDGTSTPNNLGNGDGGIDVIGGDNNLITDNVIAFNDVDGVEISPTSVGNRILSNSIFSNSALGIDLNPGGREQDPKDPDTGANNLQNFPVITQATTTGTATTIQGTLNSKPRKTFTLQFFSSPAGDDEGKTYLGQINVKTKRNGTASFNVLGPAVAQGEEITATATNLSTGDTSEFSDAVAVTPAS